jgi:hypothetical protein
MAVTVQSQPAIYVPSYNNQWFVATSTQVAQPNFKYRVVMTDLISGYTITEDCNPNPSNELEIDVSKFSELNMLNYLPANQYGWKKCIGASRKIRVNIGEYYGTTPAYYAGSNIDYIVWNGALELFDFSTYLVTDYVYDTGGSTYPYPFLSTLNSKTYIDRSNYLYALVLEGATTFLDSILINTYDSAGSIIGQYQINRPSYSTGLYTDQYQCIDIGYKGLANMPGAQVTVITGPVTITDPALSYYTVTDGSQTWTINVDCAQFDVYTLHYLNSKGGYDTLHCKMFTELNSTKTTTSFKKSPWSRSGYVKVLDTSGAVENTLSVNLQDGLRVNTDWLTQAEFDQHKDLFASPDVRLDLGSTTAYKSVKITNTSYTQRNRDRLRSLTFDILFNHSNQRQKG